MSRNLNILLFILVAAGAAFLLDHKVVLIESVEQGQPIGEFGGVSLRLEYATTTTARELGLGGRVSIAPDEAMLFVFPLDDYYGFWMNNMLMPIDMFWLDDKGQVVSIEENVATSTYPNVFYPDAPARYVLETIAGFAQEHSIIIGTPLVLKNFPSVTE